MTRCVAAPFSSAKGNPDVHISVGRVQWSGPPGPGAAVFGLPWVLHLCTVSSSTATASLLRAHWGSWVHQLVLSYYPGTRRFGIQPVHVCGEEIALKWSPSSPGGTCFYDDHVSVLMVMRYLNWKAQMQHFDFNNKMVFRCLYQQDVIHPSGREIFGWLLQSLAPRWVLQVDVWPIWIPL